MKKVLKKNQIIIAVLALMIATAGYLNYSGRLFGNEKKAAKTSGELANKELLDISEEDLAETSQEIENPEAGESNEEGESEGEVDGNPGEAVLTSGTVSGIAAEAKVTREQMRAKNKEMLMEIVDNEQLSQDQKSDAVNQVVLITEMSEKEVAAEALLASKGFPDSVVSLTEDSADVLVGGELDDAKLAQIEDIVTRKTGVRPEKIVITPMQQNK